MSDEITPAPRVPQPTAAPAPAHATEAHNFSRPGTAHAAPSMATHTAPTTGVTSSTLPPTTAQHATAEDHQTLNEKLNNSDRYWKFKTGLHILTIIFGLIGIGTIGWCVSTMGDGYSSYGDYMGYGYDQYWTLWPTLVTFAVSIIWSFICIAVFVLRKRAVHPGLRVAMELLLWLGFIVTALFAVVALLEIFSWGVDGNLGYSSSYGNYVLANNGTWVWEQDDRDSGSSSTYYGSSSYQRPCNRTTTASSSYYTGFRNCADQDAYVNKMWQEKPHRQSVELTGVVMQFFGLLLHFALFVWACVDCNRYNRTKTSKDAEKIAAGIVQTMITNGAVVPPPGQAHMRPAWAQPQMGYYQLPPQQGYPMANMHPQQMAPHESGAPQQYYGPQHSGGLSTGSIAGPVPGPIDEKSQGPRYL
jgi:hypothetical protein